MLFLVATPNARADLMIELDGSAFQAQRILVKPPRVRIESGTDGYRLYDREMDAMVTVLTAQGVYFEDELSALRRQRERFIQTLRENRGSIEDALSDATDRERDYWSDMVTRWRLDEEDGAAVDSLPAPTIEKLESRDEKASAGGFECSMYEVELTARVDSMRACLAELDELGVTRADFETLRAMLDYLGRLHELTAPPDTIDRPTLPPRLIAELMERTGMMVLGAARWQSDTGTEWQVHDLWSAFVEPSQFSVEDQYRRIEPPYAR